MGKSFKLEGVLSLNSRPFTKRLRGATRAAGKFSKGLARMGLKGVGVAAAASSAALVGFGAVASRTIANFGQEMSKVQALTGASGEQLEALTKKARDMGATTMFSASEAAAGMAFLAQAGFDTNKILASSEDLLNLAAAGGLDLAEAMDIASNIMTPFNMKAEESARVSDVLAKTASSSNTNVTQLGEAFKKVAPISAQLGISFEETAAAIGVLGNAGIQASDAGTALKNIMARLVKPTSEVESGLAKLGLSASDVNPATKSLTEIMATFQKAAKASGDRATVAAAGVQIFGLRANAAGGVLMNAGGEIGRFADTLTKAEGAAKDMSKTMMDNLGGDFKMLKSIFQEVQLAIGEGGLTSVLREAAQWAANLMRSFVDSGKAKAVGKAIREAADAFRGAFTNPDLLMNALSSGLKLAATSFLHILYHGGGKFVGAIWNGLKKVANWLMDVFQGVGTLLATGFVVAVAQLTLGLMDAGKSFIALIQAGLEKATDALMIGLSKIPGLNKYLGIEGFEKSVGTFGEYFKSYKDSLDSSTRGATEGISAIRDYAAAGAAEALKRIEGKGTFSAIQKYFQDIQSGKALGDATKAFQDAVAKLAEAGRKEREAASKEREKDAKKEEKKTAPAIAKATAKAQASRPNKVRVEGASGLHGARGLDGASGLDGSGPRSKTGGYGGWRFGDAKRRKAALEAQKKKTEAEKLQTEANALLKEQNGILKTALVPTGG